MMKAPLPRVLCVDDEEAVLDGLTRTLRGRYAITTAVGGAEALDLIAHQPAFAVIVSDMRMPGMDGAALLAQAASHAPDTVRLLLTGQTDLYSAIAAVNSGGIFRFLTKPCPTEELTAAIDVAVEQHRLILAERELLEQTLRGSINALLEILSLANPRAFARAERIRQFVAHTVRDLDLPNGWEIDVAAALAHVGAVTLPGHVTAKLDQGFPLDDSEVAMVQGLPAVADSLISSIPRLEAVRDIIRTAAEPWTPDTSVGAALIRIATDVDHLESLGRSRRQAVVELGAVPRRYDDALLERILATMPAAEADNEPSEQHLRVPELRIGMVIAADVHDTNGALLVGRGMPVTERLLETLSNLRNRLSGPIVVFTPTGSTEAAPAGAESPG